ncbi:protein O-linked-mannose beta-1,2-N-acetylglucosaminyltransferase 1-like [Physella acuta]|nr:protein O-linked-mannose beta-1,2-N-acetylglucosaminyltransferase 1-like [Physella acuta]
MIIIEEDLLLAPDFMPFMAECLKIISLDTSLVGAFAWNVNGFEQISGNNSQVYRVQEFPGLGFLVKSDIIQQLIETNSECCDHRAWFGWHMETQGLEMLMPDVSRVYKTPFDGAQALTDVARNLFLKPRKTFLELQPASLDISHLISTEYETFLHGQIDVSSVVLPADLLPCIQQLSSPPDMKSFQGPLVINYYQNSTDDYSLLIKLCQCFGLVTLDNYQPKNLHNGLLRFYHQEHDVFLIGTKTQYFNSLIDPKYVLKEELLLINYTFINTNKDR